MKLRQLEKLGKKAGVVEQTVKDVVQGLVDDNMVNQDKVGSMNVFYSFPSAQLVRIKNEIEKVETKKASVLAQTAATKTAIETLNEKRKVCAERTASLRELANLREKEAKLNEQIQVWKKNDPSVLREIEKRSEIAKNAANRWTDNIWTFESYLVKKRNIDRKAVKKLLKITDAFDYVE